MLDGPQQGARVAAPCGGVGNVMPQQAADGMGMGGGWPLLCAPAATNQAGAPASRLCSLLRLPVLGDGGKRRPRPRATAPNPSPGRAAHGCAGCADRQLSCVRLFRAAWGLQRPLSLLLRGSRGESHPKVADGGLVSLDLG